MRSSHLESGGSTTRLPPLSPLDQGVAGGTDVPSETSRGARSPTTVVGVRHDLATATVGPLRRRLAVDRVSLPTGTSRAVAEPSCRLPLVEGERIESVGLRLM